MDSIATELLGQRPARWDELLDRLKAAEDKLIEWTGLTDRAECRNIVNDPSLLPGAAADERNLGAALNRLRGRCLVHQLLRGCLTI